MARMEIEARLNPDATFAANAFTDICWEDFAKSRLGFRAPMPGRNPVPLQAAQHPAAAAILKHQPSIDWRSKGAVNAIQDQGHCGSCWAFGTTANIEAQYFLWGNKPGENGTLKKLSEQMFVSCDHYKDATGTDNGCKGGWPDRAVHWLVSKTNGLAEEKNYPYVSGGGQVPQCDSSKESAAFPSNVVGIQDLLPNETYVAAYVARFGPVTVGLDATSDWQQYSGGILNASCASKNANHAVAIVGYGSDGGKDYWLIRNSWGEKWGEKGYIRLARNAGNCNSVVGHATSVFFKNRTACLSPCKKAAPCCGGECCPDDKNHTCCAAGGCCTSPSTCCGALGGHQCCDDPKKCCGGQCCGAGSVCSKDRKTCCPLQSVCGDECCAEGAQCCRSGMGKARCAKSMSDTCCQDGSSCPVMSTCCVNPNTQKSTCCPSSQQCDSSSGECRAPGPPPPPFPCGRNPFCPGDNQCCKGPKSSMCCPKGLPCNTSTGRCGH